MLQIGQLAVNTSGCTIVHVLQVFMYLIKIMHLFQLHLYLYFAFWLKIVLEKHFMALEKSWNFMVTLESCFGLVLK